MPRNSHGVWPFWRPRELVPGVLVITREEHAATRVKPGVSPLQARRGPFPLQRLEGNHTFPLELRKGLSHPWCKSRRTPTYPSPLEKNTERPPNIKGSTVSASQLVMRVPFPDSTGKDSWLSSRMSRRGTLNRKVERNSRGRANIPKSPNCLSPL